MRNIVVADSRKHAEAVIAWCKLDREIWEPVAYGETLAGRYDYARIVRPSEGVQNGHLDWILEILVPSVDKTTSPIPPDWRLAPPEPKEGPQLATVEVA
jgi:hypothetical protein